MEEKEIALAGAIPLKEKEKEVTIVDVATDAATAGNVNYVKSFVVTWKNQETGVVKVGTFTATRPGIGKLGQIAVLKAKLNGGMTIDPLNDFSHHMRAALHYVLTDTPDWWKPDEFFTADPLRDVWDHVEAWLHNFRSKRPG
jgi:hypothetical protein